MSNFMKEKEYVITRDLEDGRRIMVVGVLSQTTYQHRLKVVETLNTKGGEEILEFGAVANVPMTIFGNSKGICKRLFIGWSIADKADVESEKWNEEIGKQIAYRRFGRPLETYNFTFLNEDMVNAILNNEILYISTNIEKYVNRKKSK